MFPFGVEMIWMNRIYDPFGVFSSFSIMWKWNWDRNSKDCNMISLQNKKLKKVNSLFTKVSHVTLRDSICSPLHQMKEYFRKKNDKYSFRRKPQYNQIHPTQEVKTHKKNNSKGTRMINNIGRNKR